MKKYVAWKVTCLVIFTVYVLWLYNTLRFDEPELHSVNNGMSIFWAFVASCFITLVLVLGYFHNEYWVVIVVGTVSAVLSFQEFWALRSEDSWRMTYLCLIAVGLALFVLPLDKLLIAKIEERRNRKNGSPPAAGPRPSTPPPSTAAESPGLSVGGFGRSG